MRPLEIRPFDIKHNQQTIFGYQTLTHNIGDTGAKRINNHELRTIVFTAAQLLRLDQIRSNDVWFTQILRPFIYYSTKTSTERSANVYYITSHQTGLNMMRKINCYTNVLLSASNLTGRTRQEKLSCVGCNEPRRLRRNWRASIRQRGVYCSLYNNWYPNQATRLCLGHAYIRCRSGYVEWPAGIQLTFRGGKGRHRT